MGWVRRDYKAHFIPTPLPWVEAPSTRAGSPGPREEYILYTYYYIHLSIFIYYILYINYTL